MKIIATVGMNVNNESNITRESVLNLLKSLPCGGEDVNYFWCGDGSVLGEESDDTMIIAYYDDNGMLQCETTDYADALGVGVEGYLF